MPTELKEKEVRELAQRFQDVRGLVLADFTGLTVEAVTDLRNRCRQANLRYIVVKNRLARLAVRDTPLESISDYLRGPTGVVLATEDPAGPARIVAEFQRQYGKPRLKGAWVEGTVLGEDRVASLATLPTRQQLLAQVSAGIGAPLSGLVYTLGALLGNLTGVIDGIRQKKEASAS
ncbi:50S ribosomal protein L10 [Candidatus Fermentibacteria bacterium]|nr:50S ribosomal protein L10 [Candidatus Fermentibacteria bacterium]